MPFVQTIGDWGKVLVAKESARSTIYLFMTNFLPAASSNIQQSLIAGWRIYIFIFATSDFRIVAVWSLRYVTGA